jgi:hypothetical protein
VAKIHLALRGTHPWLEGGDCSIEAISVKNYFCDRGLDIEGQLGFRRFSLVEVNIMARQTAEFEGIWH